MFFSQFLGGMRLINSVGDGVEAEPALIQFEQAEIADLGGGASFAGEEGDHFSDFKVGFYQNGTT